MILFDWGTYNALTKLPVAAAIGSKLTEIPPYELARRYPEDHYDQYREFARKAFTTITAHGPYYNVVSTDPATQKRSERGHVMAAQRAARAGAEVYNLHLGWRAYMDHRDVEVAAQVIKKILEAVPDIVVTIEVAYTKRMLGTWDEIKAIREMTDPERVQVSVQLENAWMLETGAGDTGNFVEANRIANEEFWWRILEKTLALSSKYLSLRFSQVVGFALGRRVLKKRVPLGKGYPDLTPLARALAKFMVTEVRDKGREMKMHLIYTGPMDTKYRDTITLFAEVMREAVPYLR